MGIDDIGSFHDSTIEEQIEAVWLCAKKTGLVKKCMEHPKF